MKTSPLNPAAELVPFLEKLPPGRALDLACGSGRHSSWLADRGWQVTGVDRIAEPLDGVTTIRADLERGEYRIEPDAWGVIICWLYWQPDLIPSIAAGVKRGGVVAMAGKTTGRFAVSLEEIRSGFSGWEQLASGENQTRCFVIVRRTG